MRKGVCIEGQKILLDISNSGGDTLDISVLTPAGAVPPHSITDYIKTWLDLDRNLENFYNMAAADPLLSTLTTKYPGLRLIGINNLFEALSWSIIGQQINLNFAYKLKRALVENFGSYQQFDGNHYYFFPTPETLAAVKKEDLLALQFSKQKADYLIRLGNTFQEKGISKDHLQQLGFNDAIVQLSSLHGIGPWTANYVAMRCLKFMEAFPMGDAGLQNAIKNLWGQKEKPTMAQLNILSQKWSGWQAYATLFLWRSLSNKV